MTAHFEVSAPNRERRSSGRRSLKLGVGGSGDVTIRDMSLTGMLVESSAPMLVGTTFDVILPHADTIHAVVIWNSGNSYGCEFHEPITPATLSAAQLQSAPKDVVLPARDVVAGLRDLITQVDHIASELDRIIDRLGGK